MVNAQVYKGVRSGVQPVAIKVLSEVNDAEAAAFAEVRCHFAADCACSSKLAFVAAAVGAVSITLPSC